MGKKSKKCSICGAELGCLDDLIIHEAEHESGCEHDALKGPSATEYNKVANALKGYDAEYLGGHIKFPGQTQVKLRLDETKLNVTSVIYSFEPFLSIPYKSIIAVQVLSSEQASSFFAIGNNANMLALTIGTSLLVNNLVNKPELFLVLTFSDECNIQQSVTFQMQRVEKAQQDIYVKVAQAKRKKKQ